MTRSKYFAYFATVMLLSVSCAEDKPIEPTKDSVIKVPSEAATIQAGINLAGTGDTVLVARGEYSGQGFYDVDFMGKSIVVRSAAGPLQTVLVLSGSSSDPHTGFLFMNNEDASSVLEGFTLINGSSTSGGALECRSASPTIRECIFAGNEGRVSGGAIRCKDSSPHIENCTFAFNSSPSGAAIFCIANSSPKIANCIFAYNQSGSAIYATDNGSRPELTCCDLFDNEGGNWLSIEEQEYRNGNFSSDPNFCDKGGPGFRLHFYSPCLPDSNDCGVLVGASDDPCE